MSGLHEPLLFAALAFALAGVLVRPVALGSARLAARDPAAVPTVRRAVITGLLLALALWSVGVLVGPRPALAGYAAMAVAAVVLGAVDLASHRLPDRVTYPAAAVVVSSFLVDAAVLDTWPALLRSLLAGGAAFGVAALAAAASPSGLGFGDVKLIGLLGLVLGWVSWEALLLGVLLGLAFGAVVALALMALGRAGWRTALPFGPPLLVGAGVALVLQLAEFGPCCAG
jgi:leader peptidase (prepilin peptidase)/N-methyltransferase